MTLDFWKAYAAIGELRRDDFEEKGYWCCSVSSSERSSNHFSQLAIHDIWFLTRIWWWSILTSGLMCHQCRSTLEGSFKDFP